VVRQGARHGKLRQSQILRDLIESMPLTAIAAVPRKYRPCLLKK
jgi:hypothetical protein